MRCPRVGPEGTGRKERSAAGSSIRNRCGVAIRCLGNPTLSQAFPRKSCDKGGATRYFKVLLGFGKIPTQAKNGLPPQPAKTARSGDPGLEWGTQDDKIHTSANTGQEWGTRDFVFTSALTGEGVDRLRAEILRHIGGEGEVQIESGFLTNVRHEGLIKDSLAALDAAKMAVGAKIPHEMLLLDLYGALRPLDAITGATTTDDILNLIFSTFCIGK
jgi:hypothetical protein